MARAFLVFILSIFVCLQIVHGQFGDEEACAAVNGGAGICVNLVSCEPYMKVITRDTVSNPVTTWLLRQAHCGFDGNSPKVCCPIDEQEDEKSNLIELVTQSPIRKVRTTSLPSTTTMFPTTSTLPATTSTLPPTTPSLPTTTTSLPTTTSTLPPTKPALPTATTSLPTTTSTLPPKTSTKSAVVPITRHAEPQNLNYDLLSLVGETCKTVYNTTGSCSELFLCEPFLAVMKQASTNPAVAVMLKKAHCGFAGTVPKVCCPLPGQSIPTLTPPTTTKSTELPSANARAGGDFLVALPEPPVCGTSNISLDRVVGGVPAKLGAFPWMALLAYRDESIATGVRWKCGGVLVSTRHVLTAAHCIHRMEDELFLVRLGELDLARDDEGATPVDILIKDMFKHEQYTKNNPVVNDIGMLVLQRDVEFTNLIRPICLPSKKWRSNTFEDFNPFVAGWGDTKWQGVSATHLQVAQVPVISAPACEMAYSDNVRAKTRAQFSSQALCAGYLSGKIDSCSGDSGGPLMQPLPTEGHKTSYYTIGVVSFGRKCAQAGSPGVYARVTYYMPWIEEKLLGTST